MTTIRPRTKPKTKTISAATKTISQKEFAKMKAEYIAMEKTIEMLQTKLVESEMKMKTFFTDLKLMLNE